MIGWMLVAPAAWAADWPNRPPGPTEPGDGRRDAALVVGIEDYAAVDDVAGARDVADEWYRWLADSRRVPQPKLHRLSDRQAAAPEIRTALAAAAAEVQAGGTLWVVFVGHGAPSRDGRDGLLVGADAAPSADGIEQRSVSRSALLAAAEGSAGTPVVVLDAGFSGQTATGTPLVPGRELPAPRFTTARGQRSIVLSATSGGELAGPMPGTGRPALAHLVLGALRGWADANGDGSVSASEVVDYAQDALRATAPDRTQTPSWFGPDATLATAEEEGPDLASLARSTSPAPAPATSPTVGELVWVPPGTFTMGSRSTAWGHHPDETRHDVRLTQGFYLMVHEVTQAQFASVMGFATATKQRSWSGEEHGSCAAYEGVSLVGDALPVTCVTWDEAVEFARRLSAKEGVTYRLPTEAEWEYASRARGGGRQWSGTGRESDLCRAANVADATATARWSTWTGATCSDGVAGLAPVGSYLPNGWGLYDMSGNVSEWVSDLYMQSGSNAATDPRAVMGDWERVHRGGSWSDRPLSARVMSRARLAPDCRDFNLGFRVARVP